MASEKESNGRKESVKIRQRKLSDGPTSLYLDIMHNGKRTREFLKLYLNLSSTYKCNFLGADNKQ